MLLDYLSIRHRDRSQRLIDSAWLCGGAGVEPASPVGALPVELPAYFSVKPDAGHARRQQHGDDLGVTLRRRADKCVVLDFLIAHVPDCYRVVHCILLSMLWSLPPSRLCGAPQRLTSADRMTGGVASLFYAAAS